MKQQIHNGVESEQGRARFSTRLMAMDPYELERAAREASASDGDGSRTLARQAADAYRARLAVDPDDAAAAAGWLRALRRAGAGWDEVGPAVEATTCRFAADGAVLGAAAFLFLDGAQDRAELGDLAGAASRLAAALGALPSQRDGKFIALASLRPLRSLARAAAEGVERNPEVVLPALDGLIEALARVVPAWNAALPDRRADGPGATQDAAEERGPSPRLVGWLAIRRLGLVAERWDLLADLLGQARESGVHDEWLADTEVEALLRSERASEAEARIAAARREHPRSEALSRREAWVLTQVGRDSEAEAVLSEAVLMAHTPWPWRDLAERMKTQGKDDEAARLVACALAFEDYADQGPTWGLHLDLAEHALAQGDEPRAAEELWLAARARHRSGWGVGKRLGKVLREVSAFLGARLDALDAEPDEAWIKVVRAGYRQAHAAYLEERARAARLVSLKSAFGLFEVEGLAGVVFASRRLPGAERWIQGGEYRVVAISSYDPKRGRPGWRAVHVLPAAAGPAS